MGFLRGLLGQIARILTFEAPTSEEEFVLDTQAKLPGLTSDVPPRAPSPAPQPQGAAREDGSTRPGFVRPRFVRPLSLSDLKARRNERAGAAAATGGPRAGAGSDEGAGNDEGADDQLADEMKPFTSDLQANLDALKRVLHYGVNADVVIREFDLPTDPPTRAAIVFIEGLASREIIDLAVLQPLMLISMLEHRPAPSDALTLVERRLLPGNQVTRKDNIRGAVEGIIAGTTCVLVDGCDVVLEVETKSWEHRMVTTPTSEMVVRGPQEAFTETLKANVALVRRRLRTPDFVNEMLKVGTLSRVDCAILYVEGIANPKLVSEVKRRVSGVRTDHVQDTGALEQFIEDRPLTLIPQTHATERPDRMAAFLAEGHVGVMIDGSPFGLIVPATFWSLVHAAEDYFLRWPFGTFLRIVRLLGLAVGVLLPAAYIAMTNFHPEMIPTDLLLAIAATRERVPFPTVVEVLVMEMSFELIREAGIRVPGVIGPTLGIVGALILGQAAVAASIVSPILVIIVAITALGSLSVPNFNMAFAARLSRFMYILLAGAFGFYGIAVGLFAQIMLYVNTRSFGVPFMSPVAPYARSDGDLVVRYPSWTMELRPAFLQTRQRVRQPEVSREWTPSGRDGHAGRGDRGGDNG